MCAMTMATAVEAKSSKKDRVMILEVKINSSASDISASVCGEASLTITGTGFANKDFPLVFLGNQGNTDLGDLIVCVDEALESPSDTVIDVECPLSGIFPVCPIGDFRLEVFTKQGGKSFKKSSKSSNHYDSYDLTIGSGGGSGGESGSLSIYTVAQLGVTEEGSETFDVVASCDDGDEVIGGGFHCDGVDACPITNIMSSSKSSAANWTVSVFLPQATGDGGPLTTSVFAQAICLDLGTIHIPPPQYLPVPPLPP